MRTRTATLWGAIIVLITVRCGGDGGGPSAPPADIQAASGDGQQGFVGQALAAALRVVVTDTDGDPVRNASVDWAVTAGGGSVSPQRSSSGADGVAQTMLTLGPGAGPNRATATVGSLPPVTFTALGMTTVVDPSMDTFETGQPPGAVPPDLIRVSAAPDGINLVVRFEFRFPVVQQTTGGPNLVTGYLDIDTDQNPATGVQPATDVFRPAGGSTGMGSEFFLAMFDGPYDVVRTTDFMAIGTVVPTFGGNQFVVAIPLALLGGDDGRVNLATVVGTSDEPTDIAPNDGSLGIAFSAAGSAGRLGPAVRMPRRGAARVWGDLR